MHHGEIECQAPEQPEGSTWYPPLSSDQRQSSARYDSQYDISSIPRGLHITQRKWRYLLYPLVQASYGHRCTLEMPSSGTWPHRPEPTPGRANPL